MIFNTNMIKLNSLLLISLILTNFGFTICDECPDKLFDCGNGECIAPFWRCDDDNDCGNWADEHNCGLHHSQKKVNCPENYHRCNDSIGTCIPDKWKCDGTKDCDNGSDELNCTVNLNCPGYKCLDQHCIPLSWRCDGVPDCEDNSDETDCVSHAKGHFCIKERGYFQCKTGECIRSEKVCNKVKDCPEGDDEGIECGDNQCHKKACAHACIPTSFGPECYCKSGFRLAQDGLSCIDINECDENMDDGICSQKCKNNEGGYECDCVDGFKLVNNTSCVVKEGEPLLVFSNGAEIRGMFLQSKRYFLIHEAVKQALGLDFYVEHEKIFWIDTNKTDNIVYSASINKENQIETVISKGLEAPEYLAVDWIGKNLYITDAGLRAIIVCQIDGKICSTIIRIKDARPRGIALNPANGIFYWSKWGKNAGIQQNWMDGTHEITIINKDIIWPNGLTLDININRLYWSEAKLNRIEYYDLNKKIRKVLLQDKVFHPFSLAVFEDNLFWGDWVTYSIETCNKFTGHQQHIVVRQPGHYMMGIHVYHPTSQKHSYNPCFLSLCSHHCLIVPGKNYACACPENMTLSSNNLTCISKNKHHELESRKNNSTLNGTLKTDKNCTHGNCSNDHDLCEHDPHQMKCSNGVGCVPLSWICDGVKDCKDGSDESRCHQISCKSTDFRCGNNICILGQFRCDREKDCTDGSDEEGCDYEAEQSFCPAHKFKCKANGQCIYRHEICDGMNDCIDGEDEQNCGVVCHDLTDFRCADQASCIPNAWLCDGEKDCNDGSDENNCKNEKQVVHRLFATPKPTIEIATDRIKLVESTTQHHSAISSSSTKSIHKTTGSIPTKSRFSTEEPTHKTTFSPKKYKTKLEKNLLTTNDESFKGESNFKLRASAEEDSEDNSSVKDWMTVGICFLLLVIFIGTITIYYKKNDYSLRPDWIAIYKNGKKRIVNFKNPIYNKKVPILKEYDDEMEDEEQLNEH